MSKTIGPSRVYASISKRKTGGNQATGAVNGTFTAVTFQTQDRALGDSDYFTNTSDTVITIAQPGIYRAYYRILAYEAAAGTDHGWESRATLNGAPIAGSGSRANTRATALEAAANAAFFVFDVTAANSTFSVEGAPLEATAVQMINESILTLELVRLT